MIKNYKDKNEVMYQSDSDVYDVENNKFPQKRIESICYLIKNRPNIQGNKVLDVGCGNGQLLYNLRAFYDELWGIDFSNAAANNAKQNLRGIENRCTLIGADIIEVDLAENFFDCVVSSDTIEHIPDVISLFKKVNKILKMDGYFVFNTPNVMYLRYRIKFMCGKFPYTSLSRDIKGEDALFDGGHLHYFTFEILREFSDAFGFEIEYQGGYGRLRKLHNMYPPLTSGSCQFILRKKQNIE